MNTGIRLGGAALAALLSGCASLSSRHDDLALQREALKGLEKPVPQALATAPGAEVAVIPSSDIAKGSGQFIRPVGLAKPRVLPVGKDTFTFNFEDQPIEAVVKVVLGDMLHENYSITPGVAGNISFSTSKPVRQDQALLILETLLSWTQNALVRDGDRYVVMPSRDAVAGNIAPSLGASTPRDGLQARLFPLQFISAVEMQKLIKPFARQDSVLLADPARNVLVMAGSSSELDNYQRTIDTFDVDWLRGMSVGVFNLERANVKEIMPALDGLFGAKSGTPVAGLMRFMPIERSNALVVISPQAAYLEEVKGWIDRIDGGGGNEPRLFVYDVRNLPATDMAEYLSNLYGGGTSQRSDGAGRVAPGLNSGTQGADDFGAATSFDTDNKSGRGDSNPDFFSSSVTSPATSVGSSPAAGDLGVRIAAVEANNQLIVRARPAQWAEIEEVIRRLDAIPLQVQIETRILEVALRNEFEFGVQWYLEGLIGGGQPGNKQQWKLGANFPKDSGKDTFYYSFVNNEIQAKVRALETNSNTKTLSSPSLVVVNNQKARIQVGDQIPVVQTYVQTNSNLGNQVGQVEYKDTGVILQVKPRINPGGLVYLQISQEVSDARPSDGSGNLTIGKRQLSTQVAIQSGQTVLLGGLIQQKNTRTKSGVPYLSRIPVLGNLFGGTTRNDGRTELIVLITPKVIANGEDAKRVADEFRERFRSLEPTKPAGQGNKAEDEV
ncbi:type II secretion system protein D (GspD) [Luteibacter rhizovicinus]|uniref:Type II secretion system protein D (GspD) n=1 Tax=Luteibacter rhizovicinus TaxID=242606 RepID=A0A4R3YI47_9GAMM|nr:type II secretion system secretin GspD [Luteibacter rhizovicinus]TCV92017.1 type II secretion system protein D (GspD) [Luteibacter rhizovicinus]